MERVGEKKEAKLLLQAVFERSLEAIVIIDRQHLLVEVNPSACKLFGLTREELVGKSIVNFLSLPLKTRQKWNFEEIQIFNSQQKQQTVEYSLVEELLPNYNLLILRNVTNLKRAAQEELNRHHQRIQLFSEVTLKIRRSLQLKEILQTAVTEVQRILKADRVLIYQVGRWNWHLY